MGPNEQLESEFLRHRTTSHTHTDARQRQSVATRGDKVVIGQVPPSRLARLNASSAVKDRALHKR